MHSSSDNCIRVRERFFKELMLAPCIAMCFKTGPSRISVATVGMTVT